MPEFRVKIYKVDRRYTVGERLVGTHIFDRKDLFAVQREIDQLTYDLYPTEQYRFEVTPKTKIVKSYMTGSDVEIDYDTPHCCDPSTETYWSM